MRKLRLTDDATAAIADIAAYVAEAAGSIGAGERLAEQLFDRCDRLASLPGTLGRERPELRPGLRSVSFKAYVIFFRYEGDTLEVVSVVEGHRDLGAYFDDEEA